VIFGLNTRYSNLNLFLSRSVRRIFFRKGDQRGIFTPQIPASIMQLVHEENLQFMKNRGMYSPSYFTFIRKLVEANLVRIGENCMDQMVLNVGFVSLRDISVVLEGY